MLPARQRRSGFGGLSSEKLDRLASSPNPFVAGRVVPEQGDAGGKKKDPSSDVAATPTIAQRADRRSPENETSGFALSLRHSLVAAQRASTILQLSFA